MSFSLISLILLGGLVVLIALGIEIFVSMGLVAGIGLWFFVGDSLSQYANTSWSVVNSFTLTCVPFFVFMGSLFSNSGVMKSLFYAADKWLRVIPGGLACSVLGANAIFGAMSGSSVAATATFGKIAFPEMEKLGYKPKLGLGSIVAGGSLSVLVPPSIILVVYGGWQEISIARLFAGALIPSLILVSTFLLTIILYVKIKPDIVPDSEKTSLSSKLLAALHISPFLIVIIVVLGSVFSGIMTPTESAAMGAFLSIVFTLTYRRLTYEVFIASLFDAVKITSMICFVMISARVLGYTFQNIGITQAFSSFMIGLPLGRYGILISLFAMYLFLGMFFDSFSMLLLTLPFVSPLLSSLGFDLLWFGIVFVILAEIGLMTPPFGLNLFVLQAVVPKHDLFVVALSALPFFIPALLVVALLTIYPEIVLWLPSLLY